MYYGAGNYEAFAHPKKPEGVENKSAYIVGTGLASLAAGVFLIRDAQMPGDHVHFLERDPRAGGACDGWDYPALGFTMRGGREVRLPSRPSIGFPDPIGASKPHLQRNGLPPGKNRRP